MFTHGVPQRDDLGIFTVAHRATRLSTHGDLLLRNCHSPMILCCFISPSLRKDDDVSSVAPFAFMINLSRGLVPVSLRITGKLRSFACSLAVPVEGGAETFDQSVSA